MQGLEKKTIEIDGESIICEYRLASKNAVIIHGAGVSTQRKKYYPVVEELIKHNIGVVIFDLAGHGESTGKLSQSSLERRKQQTIEVIDSIIPKSSTLYLVGFSMGAQTVCDLLPHYEDSVEGILLGCPAIYRADVQDLPFGTDTFTAMLREPNSWTTSRATHYLSNYEGKTVIGIGDKDDVIPQGVIEILKAAAKNLRYIELKGATHALMAWLPEHPDKLTELIDALAGDS